MELWTPPIAADYLQILPPVHRHAICFPDAELEVRVHFPRPLSFCLLFPLDSSPATMERDAGRHRANMSYIGLSPETMTARRPEFHMISVSTTNKQHPEVTHNQIPYSSFPIRALRLIRAEQCLPRHRSRFRLRSKLRRSISVVSPGKSIPLRRTKSFPIRPQRSSISSRSSGVSVIDFLSLTSRPMLHCPVGDRQSPCFPRTSNQSVPSLSSCTSPPISRNFLTVPRSLGVSRPQRRTQ